MTAVVVADASLALVVPQLTAQLAGLVQLQASLVISPPTIAGSIALAQQLIASLQAAITLPGASLNITAIAAAIAQLSALLGSLQAQVAAVASLNVSLGTPGVWAYSYEGTPALFGPDFAAEIGGGLPDSLDPNLPVYAVVFVASDAGAIEAMRLAMAS